MRETDAEFGVAHDRYLANYTSYDTDAYCINPKCERYGEPYPVRYEEEYGQGSISPEECSDCGDGLSLDLPEPIEEEDDDSSPEGNESP